MNFEDVEAGLLVRGRKLNLTIDTARSQQGRVQDVDTVRSHNNLSNKRVPDRESLGGFENKSSLK